MGWDATLTTPFNLTLAPLSSIAAFKNEGLIRESWWSYLGSGAGYSSIKS